MNSHDVIRVLSERKPEIREQFGVRDLAIFGSVARNEARPDSDLDVLVEFADRPTFSNFMGLKLFLEDLFGVAVDLGTPGALRTEIRPQVEREMIYVP